jgi:hypothetical protein
VLKSAGFEELQSESIGESRAGIWMLIEITQVNGTFPRSYCCALGRSRFRANALIGPFPWSGMEARKGEKVVSGGV